MLEGAQAEKPLDDVLWNKHAFQTQKEKMTISVMPKMNIDSMETFVGGLKFVSRIDTNHDKAI